MDLLGNIKGQALTGWGSQVPMGTSLPILLEFSVLFYQQALQTLFHEGSVNYVTAGLG